LFVVLLSKLILQEHVGRTLWFALVVGFAASILIIRPGPSGVDPSGLLALASGLSMACYAILVKASLSGLRRVFTNDTYFPNTFCGLFYCPAHSPDKLGIHHPISMGTGIQHSVLWVLL